MLIYYLNSMIQVIYKFYQLTLKMKVYKVLVKYRDNNMLLIMKDQFNLHNYNKFNI